MKRWWPFVRDIFFIILAFTIVYVWVVVQVVVKNLKYEWRRKPR